MAATNTEPPRKRRRRSKPSKKLYCGHVANHERGWCLTPETSSTGYSDHRAHRRHEERHVVRLGLCQGSFCPSCANVAQRWERNGKLDQLTVKDPPMGKRVKTIVDTIKATMKVSNLNTALDNFMMSLPAQVRNTMIKNAVRRYPEILEKLDLHLLPPLSNMGSHSQSN